MKKEDKILEWLLRNNALYCTINEYTSYSLNKEHITNVKNKEVESFFRHRDSWKNSAYPIFSGEVCYLENVSFLTKENIKTSREDLKKWLLKHVVTITKDGIVLSNECSSDEHRSSYIITGKEYLHLNNCLPELPQDYSYLQREGKTTRNCSIRRIKDCNVYSDLYFKLDWNNSYYNFIEDMLIVTDSRKNKKETKKVTIKDDPYSLLDNECNLRYKIKECQDLYIDVQNLFYSSPLYTFKSFKNFPDIVHGNFAINNFDNINSFEGFPSLCEKEVIFRNCRIPYNIVLPENVTINSNLVCTDCANDYNILIGILKYNWNIKGKIYTSLFTGSIDKLRQIATEQKWI